MVLCNQTKDQQFQTYVPIICHDLLMEVAAILKPIKIKNPPVTLLMSLITHSLTAPLAILSPQVREKKRPLMWQAKRQYRRLNPCVPLLFDHNQFIHIKT